MAKVKYLVGSFGLGVFGIRFGIAGWLQKWCKSVGGGIGV